MSQTNRQLLMGLCWRHGSCLYSLPYFRLAYLFLMCFFVVVFCFVGWKLKLSGFFFYPFQLQNAKFWVKSNLPTHLLQTDATVWLEKKPNPDGHQPSWNLLSGARIRRSKRAAQWNNKLKTTLFIIIPRADYLNFDFNNKIVVFA